MSCEESIIFELDVSSDESESCSYDKQEDMSFLVNGINENTLLISSLVISPFLSKSYL